MPTQTPPERQAQWRDFISQLNPGADPVMLDLMGKMRLFSHQVYRMSDEQLEADSVSPPQFRILMHLLFAETIELRHGLNPSEISDRQGTNRNTISTLVRNLEQNGLVKRELDESDRRKFNICLSEKGRTMVKVRAHDHIQVVDEIFSVLDEDERVIFGRIMTKLNAQIKR